MPIDSQYAIWNYIIGKNFFGPERVGQTVFLTIDQDTLWKLGQEGEARLRFASPQTALNDFTSSVCREIDRRGWTIGNLSTDQYPLFLGLLAVQVLAVFTMRDDDY